MWLFGRDPVRDFGFEMGAAEPDPEPNGVWKRLRGHRKADGQPVTVFVHTLGTGDPTGTARARCALRRFRTLRHPNILGYLDSLETEQCLYLVTEAVTPLRCHLRDAGGALSEEEVAWGLQQLLTALAFLSRSGLVHGAVGLDAVFVDPGGEWKLGGLEQVGGGGQEPAPRPPNEPPRPQDPPELSGGGNGSGEPWAGDMWRLGCLIWELFNGPLPRASALRNFGKVPRPLLAPFSQLVAADPSTRPSPEQLLELGGRPGAFLSSAIATTARGLEQLQVQDPPQRRAFLQQLPALLPSLPSAFRHHKLLPRLLQALEFGSADAAALPPLLQVAKALDPPEYQRRIVPVIVRLFASPDRALRMRLLQQLEDYIEFLPEATVSSQIFPHVARGFLDTNAAIREQTVKSLPLLAPRLPEAQRGRELPPLLCRLQGDALGPLRCNATLCLGRVAPLLPPTVRQRVLAPALARATRDPFPPTRAAAVAAFAATHRCFTAAECAGRVLPTLCPLTLDPDRSVREQAFRAIRSFLEHLEAAAESGGGTEGASPGVVAPPEAAAGGPGGLGAAVSWAVTSLTARLMGGTEGGSPPGPPLDTPAETPTETSAETPVETPTAPPQEPPSEPTPPNDFDCWDDDWGSLEDVEQPQSPPPSTKDKAELGGSQPDSPPPTAAPPRDPPSAQDEEWGTSTEWGTEDAWEALPSPRGPTPDPSRRQREQQRRREMEARRAERRGGARGPPKLGTRKLD